MNYDPTGHDPLLRNPLTAPFVFWMSLFAFTPLAYWTRSVRTATQG